MAITPLAAVLLVGVSSCVGHCSGKSSVQKDLDSKVVGNSIVINDENLGRAELVDVDQDGFYDIMTIFPKISYFTSRYQDKCRAEIYAKYGFISRIPDENSKLVVVSGNDFDNFIARSKVPRPKTPLLNTKQGYIAPLGASFPQFESYSALFNTEKLDEVKLNK